MSKERKVNASGVSPRAGALGVCLAVGNREPTDGVRRAPPNCWVSRRHPAQLRIRDFRNSRAGGRKRCDPEMEGSVTPSSRHRRPATRRLDPERRDRHSPASSTRRFVGVPR